MNVLNLLSSKEACSRLFRSIRWVNSRYGFTRVKSHGNYRNVLRDISVSLLGRHLMIRQIHYSITLGLVLYNPFFTLEVYSLYIWMGVFGIVYYLGLLGFSMYRKLNRNM
ncbi:MAG: hypothetical protein QW534_11045 [Candidatus Methanomethylicia archaeon]